MADAIPKNLYPCLICTLPFATERRQKKHTVKKHPKCGQCSKRFLERKQLQNHQKETSHVYCHECDCCFSTRYLHLQHLRTVPHTTSYECCDCGRLYPSQESLGNHCCRCDKVFKYANGLQSHFKSKAHSPNSKKAKVPSIIAQPLYPDGNPYKCKNCSDSFGSKQEFKRHKKEKHPQAKRRKPKKKAQRAIPCPASEKCKRRFATPSALLSHVESGRCKSGMTREGLNGLVVSHDSNCYITGSDAGVETKHSAGLSSSWSSILSQVTPPTIGTDAGNITISSPSIIGTESSITGATPSATLSANSDVASEWSIIPSVPPSPTESDWSFLGSILTPDETTPSILSLDLNIPAGRLRCELCPPDRTFGSVLAFQQHIMSAAHSPKIFHCPSVFIPEDEPGKKKHQIRFFSTLSGLTQHLESGACQGKLETFRRAIRYVEDQLKALGLPSVKLLIE